MCVPSARVEKEVGEVSSGVLPAIRFRSRSCGSRRQEFNAFRRYRGGNSLKILATTDVSLPSSSSFCLIYRTYICVYSRIVISGWKVVRSQVSSARDG